MKNNKSWLVVLAAVAALTSAQTVRAITYGEPDNGRHPNVGTVIVAAPWAEPFQHVSGTLIAPNLFLTAGHATSEFEFGIESGWFSLSYVYVTFADDPYDDSFWLPVAAVRTHPGYNPSTRWRMTFGRTPVGPGGFRATTWG